MPSQLRALYTALATMPLRFGGSLVASKDLDALPTTVGSADLPCRLLLPMSMRAENRGMTYATLGRNPAATADWKVVDLLLGLPIAQGSGIDSVAVALIQYQADYLEALRTLSLPKSINATLIGVGMEINAFTYPASGRTAYFGAEVTLTFREVVR